MAIVPLRRRMCPAAIFLGVCLFERVSSRADQSKVRLRQEGSSAVDMTVAARRRLLRDMARRRARPGTGSARVVLARRSAGAHRPDLTPTPAGMPWAVVGAVATRAYMPERTTQDLDILVAAADRAEVRGRLQRAGFHPVQELAIGGMTWRSPDGALVHIVESEAAWVTDALRSLEREPQGLPVLDLPDLVLMKVQAGRTQDLADAAPMLGAAAEPTRQEARDIFRRWLPDALEDLESLIALGRLERETCACSGRRAAACHAGRGARCPGCPHGRRGVRPCRWRHPTDLPATPNSATLPPSQGRRGSPWEAGPTGADVREPRPSGRIAPRCAAPSCENARDVLTRSSSARVSDRGGCHATFPDLPPCESLRLREGAV